MATIARMGRKPLGRITRTITLDKDVSRDADKLAAKERTTLSALIDEGLKLVLEQRKAKATGK